MGLTTMLFLTFITIACYFTMILTHKKASHSISQPSTATNNVIPGYRKLLNKMNVSTRNALDLSTSSAIEIHHLIERSLSPPICLDHLSTGTTRLLPMPLAWTAWKHSSNIPSIIQKSGTPVAPSFPAALYPQWSVPPNTSPMDTLPPGMRPSSHGVKSMLTASALGRFRSLTTTPSSFMPSRASTPLLTLSKYCAFMAHRPLQR